MNYGSSGWDQLKHHTWQLKNKLLRLFKPIVIAKWSQYVENTYILNLTSRKDRKNLLSKELQKIHTSNENTLLDHVEWFPAINGNQFKIDKNSISQVFGTIHISEYPFAWHWLTDPDPAFLPEMDKYLEMELECSDSEIAIAIGHILMWKKFRKSKTNSALFLEDDIVFSHDFEERFNAIMEDELPEDWDILYLSSLPSQYGFAWTEYSKNLVAIEMGVWWMSGYMLSKSGVEKLLKALPIVGPVDVWINHQFKDLNSYVVKGNIIDQNDRGMSNNTYSFQDEFWSGWSYEPPT